MGRPVKGDLVIVPFPFADLSGAKRRPALVVARAGGDKVLLAQITSRAVRDARAVRLEPSDFASGRLRLTSNIRPNRLFTANDSLIEYRTGRVVDEKLREVVGSIKEMLDAET